MDLEEFDFTIEYIKGRENVVADALSRISIKDLFQMYEENHIFKTEISPPERKIMKIKSKPKQIRCSNTILAYTRSMTNAQNNTHNNTHTQTSNLDNITPDIKIYESFTQNRKNPRVRIINCKSNTNGIPTQITLHAYQNHNKIFEIKIGLDNEKVTLFTLLSKLQHETSTLNTIQYN